MNKFEEFHEFVIKQGYRFRPNKTVEGAFEYKTRGNSKWKEFLLYEGAGKLISQKFDEMFSDIDVWDCDVWQYLESHWDTTHWNARNY